MPTRAVAEERLRHLRREHSKVHPNGQWAYIACACLVAVLAIWLNPEGMREDLGGYELTYFWLGVAVLGGIASAARYFHCTSREKELYKEIRELEDSLRD